MFSLDYQKGDWVLQRPPVLEDVKAGMKELFFLGKLDTELSNVKCVKPFSKDADNSLKLHLVEEIDQILRSLHYTEWYVMAELCNTLGILKIIDLGLP